MPECLFGCAQLIRPMYSAAPHWRDVQLPQPHIVSVPYGKIPHVESHDDAEVGISHISLAYTAGVETTRPHSLSSPLPASSSNIDASAATDGIAMSSGPSSASITAMPPPLP
jgi:hypothetical protein